jgi:ABC-2 type transport system ATP-binding protein
MSRIGFLPENPYFYPHLSLDEFLRFCGNLSNIPAAELRSRISTVSGMIGLDDALYRKMKGFSKGMLQRAGLAQAILHDPDMLVLDEPFSGLDPIGRKTVRDILLDLRRNGKTIFFSSHILPDMEALCDRTSIIRDGVVVRSIGLDEVFRIGEGKVEVTARGLAPTLLEPLKDYIESAEENGAEVFMLIRKQEFVRTVVQHLYNSGAEVLKIANHHPSLEDIFLSEIGEAAKPHVATTNASPRARQATGGRNS